MKKILVLAGGSVKGAFQAGAVRALFEAGFRPDAIYGVSAGAMNATYLVHELGRQYQQEGGTLDYVRAAHGLAAFWQERITSPESLARRRGTYELGMSAFRRNFEGLLDTEPLRELLHDTIDVHHVQACPVGLKVGAVDISDGRLVYADPSFPHFLDYVMASSAIPILMPIVKIGGNEKLPFLDGGLRDVAPLRRAIRDGATEVVCVACHPVEIDSQPFEHGNLLALVDRAMDITVNENLNADLEWAEFLNNCLPDDGTEPTIAALRGFKRMKLTILRPKSPLSIDIQEFNTDDINRLITIGYQRGREVLEP
jgi:NTE family protein